MTVRTAFCAGLLVGMAILVAGFPGGLKAQQSPVQQTSAPAIDDDDIGGIVTSRFARV